MKSKDKILVFAKIMSLLLIVGILVTVTALKSVKPDKVYVDDPLPEVARPQVELVLSPSDENKADEDSTQPSFIPLNLPDSSGRFKAWMDYNHIEDTTSTQWKLQQEATTYSNGARMYEGKFMVAVGTAYAQYCGKTLRITLDSGMYFDAIVADIKANIHTDASNRFAPSNGNIVEFIVDETKIPKVCVSTGDMSYAGFWGDIVKMEEVIYNENP